MSDKRALRREFRKGRHDYVASLAPGARDALEHALVGVVASTLANARIIASYAAAGDEIDPSGIKALAGSLAFPRVSGPTLSFHLAAPGDLLPGFKGIAEPARSVPKVMPDLLLVPLLAVTPTGVRLGQGGGYYDRALADLRRHSQVIAIGLAFDVQIADVLPAEPWDMPLDWVATPTRLFDCAKVR
ncbi:5-formyltetrahydrofolate cyclo-ligase [Sandarakinorhabdus sp.]|uniref:5-formyltetrahydrofolate cyclo-ligase n=1 Tax=Sandarakinorhabdus sp. TaxID=1916663 RepID=UPI00286DF633|nr:5-formyltetrahydrofolate cyclo-ligase [Sandarakinorhabdus sp.]